MKTTNYLKLTVTSDKPIHDEQATSLEPTANGGRAGGHFVVTWTWVFSTKADGAVALKAAQDKRLILKLVHGLDDDTFQLSSFKYAFRGVPVVGHFGRQQQTEANDLAVAS